MVSKNGVRFVVKIAVNLFVWNYSFARKKRCLSWNATIHNERPGRRQVARDIWTTPDAISHPVRHDSEHSTLQLWSVLVFSIFAAVRLAKTSSLLRCMLLAWTFRKTSLERFDKFDTDDDFQQARVKRTSRQSKGEKQTTVECIWDNYTSDFHCSKRK